MDFGAEFIGLMRAHFAGLRRRFVETLGRMSSEDLAWRANEASNSAANLALHVCGNLTQRFHAGFGGAPDERDREAEFSDRAGRTPQELIERVEATFGRVDAFLAACGPERLSETRFLVGRERTLAAELIHAATHANEHLGQVVLIAKARRGEAFGQLWRSPGPSR